jgi:hypothetical protein
MVFDAHNRAFAFFGGVPERGIYDNLKTCVDAVYVGKERRFNPRFLALMNHYLVEPTACTPAAGWEKGQVENQVGTLREWLFTPRPRFATLADLNAHLLARCRVLADERPHPDGPERRIAAVFAEEQARLRAIAQPFDGYLERDVRVSSTCLVQYDRNRYSVDARYAQRVVRLRLYPERLLVLADDTVIAEHGREFGRDKTVYNPWHYLPLLARKPGALRNGAPFTEERLPAALSQVQQRLLQRPGGDRAMVEVLLACQGEQLEAVLTACELALADGTVSADVILNLAHRLQAPLPPAPLIPPLGLELHQDILTDCSRYDRLRPSQAVAHAH